MSVQNFAHFGVCVSDPDRSMSFYCDLLGFEPLSKLVAPDNRSARLVGLEDLELHSYFLEREGIRIELLHYVSPGHEPNPAPRPMNRLGLTHIALRVEDLDGTLARLTESGFQILDSSRVGNPEFGSSVVFALDPDGVRVELIEMPGDPTAPLGEPLQWTPRLR
jgi:catechol 2,3-dioxygenase-like lactoylglutathione lyase family enzyme